MDPTIRNWSEIMRRAREKRARTDHERAEARDAAGRHALTRGRVRRAKTTGSVLLSIVRRVIPLP